MDIFSKERKFINRKRSSIYGVNIITPIVDKMIVNKEYKDVFIELGVAIVYQGDFRGLIIEAGGSMDWLFYHQYANNHIDCFNFDGELEDGFIRLLDEESLEKITLR